MPDPFNPSPPPQVQTALHEAQAEYQQWQTLFAAQPVMVQQFIQAQARLLGDALRCSIARQPISQVSFTLPDRVLLAEGSGPEGAGPEGAGPEGAGPEGAGPEGAGEFGVVPPEQRAQLAGGLLRRLARTDIRAILRQHLNELEMATERATAVSAGLIRLATAVYLIHDLLPAGRSVTYRVAENEEIPTLPVADDLTAGSAITAAGDAIAEEGADDEGRGQLLVPYVPAARRFYLPQWVAFDDDGRLLVNSLSEAEAYLASMQQFMTVLHTAVALTPYIVADPMYQQKRYGMLGQLVNQGRALARYQTNEIIRTIQQRAQARDLNRGLSLSLPYFDDQQLALKLYPFEVIPAGRIMFVPALVVRASRQEQVQVAQDTRLNISTRHYLLVNLKALEDTFAA